ncbi:hypothetical protein ACHAWO_007616 [Cyclotella atomus]|uniref:Uncharacterized protein n=1 Tax=Cyclotella atomus TaxID=382360 RepID=A0ABD3NET0_9STRA
MAFSTLALSALTALDEANAASSKKMHLSSPEHANDGSLMKNFKSLRSTDTAITTSTSSDELYAADISESSSYATTEVPKRHRYERSLTDHAYNIFLDFLESPRWDKSENSRIPAHVITDQDQVSNEELGFLESPTRSSTNITMKAFGDGTGDEVIVPCIRRTHLRHQVPMMDTAPMKMAKNNSCHDLMALTALAALLGTNIQPNNLKENTSNGIKNLWSDDTADDEIISLPDL